MHCTIQAQLPVPGSDSLDLRHHSATSVLRFCSLPGLFCKVMTTQVIWHSVSITFPSEEQGTEPCSQSRERPSAPQSEPLLLPLHPHLLFAPPTNTQELFPPRDHTLSSLTASIPAKHHVLSEAGSLAPTHLIVSMPNVQRVLTFDIQKYFFPVLW